MAQAMSRPERKKLGESLVEAGLIDGLQLRSALADQRRWGNRLGKTLVKLGFVEEQTLMRHLSRLMGQPLAEIRDRTIDPEVLALLPAGLAEKHRCLPLFVEDDGAARYLYLGMEEPADLDVLDALQLRTGFEICPVLIGYRELDQGLRRFYRLGPGGERVAAPEPAPADAALVGPDCLRHGDEALHGSETGPDEGEMFQVGFEPDARADAPAPPASAPGTAAGTPTRVGDAARRAGDEARRAGEVPTRRILHGLVQVLIDKGVLTREELVAEVKALARREGDAG